MAEVLAKTTFSSVIHNNEVCDEIVKWGNANGYPVTKAKLQNKFQHSYYRNFLRFFQNPIITLYAIISECQEIFCDFFRILKGVYI